MVLLLCGLAAFFVVQVCKFLATPKLSGQGVWQAVTKMYLAGAASFGTAILVLPEGHWRTAVAYGLGGAGLSVILHKTTRLLSNLGDDALMRFLGRK